MNTTYLASRVLRHHALDIARLLDDYRVDLLREAANGTDAGPDWYRADVRLGVISLWIMVPVVVHVGPVEIDGPYHAHVQLDWTARRLPGCRGHLILRASGTATGVRAATELMLIEARRHANPIRLPNTTRRSVEADRFVTALARRIDVTMASAVNR